MQTDITSRDQILDAMKAFAAKRPGLEPGNYLSSYYDKEGRKAYLSEMRSITKDLHHARVLLDAVRLSGITEAQMLEAFKAFGGRLSWDGKTLDYCVGQYWATEYRRAVCAVLVSALWAYWRDHCGCDTGDKIKAQSKRLLPLAVARRWFGA
jgi:hypothetical protein